MNETTSHTLSVAVVILNWNGEALLDEYLPELVEHSTYPNTRLIVADNGSTDNSKEVVDKFPDIEWLALDKNYGFALGYNKALKQVDADIYVLLNSDIRVSSQWLEPIMEMFENNPEVAIQQPKILDDKNHQLFEYAGASGGYLDTTGYPFCRGRIMDDLEEDKDQYNSQEQIFWASGACLIIRSKTWHQLDGFDEIFWAHMEEIDLCWRAQNQDAKIMVNPSSKVYHLGGGSLPYGNPKKTYLNFRNNLFLLARNLHRKEWFTTIFLRLTLDGIASAVFLVTGEHKLIPYVFKAHMHFYRALPNIIRGRKGKEFKRKNELPIFNGCIPLLSKLRKIKRFDQLNFKA